MVMSNRIDGLISHSIATNSKRLAMVSQLHYAVKHISDEAMGYVLKVVNSLAVRDDGPLMPTGLLGQTRVVITGEGTAEVAIAWSYKTDAFLSSSYSRSANGGWHCLDGKEISSRWMSELEERYLQKLKEVELVAKSEAVANGN